MNAAMTTDRLRWWQPLRDPAQERRFQDDKHAGGLNRVRVVLGAAILSVGLLGMMEVSNQVRRHPEFAFETLQLRFLVVAPIWLVALVSTGLPGHRARADTLYAVTTVGVCWALALCKWHFAFEVSSEAFGQGVMMDVLAVLVFSAFTLPMRLGHLAMATLGVTVPAGLFMVVANPSPDPTVGWNIVVSLVGIGGMVPLIVGHRDAIERRVFAQREELAALNGELARLNEEKNEFMAIAAHDLRSPLATVRGLAEQLEAGRFAGAAQGRAHGAIRDLSERMLGLVNDYLGVHAAESGTLPVRAERLDLVAVARAAAERHVVAAAAKGQRIKVGASGPVWVRADGALLAQVVDNFVGNALKFSPPGAEVRLDLARAPERGEVRLEVSDEGPGIAAAEQAGLFRKFGRASAKPTGGETSHGLGLAVAKRLAEAMGGSVGCDSRAGAGATFWVRLPGEV